jgi:hypothetical protein
MKKFVTMFAAAAVAALVFAGCGSSSSEEPSQQQEEHTGSSSAELTCPTCASWWCGGVKFYSNHSGCTTYCTQHHLGACTYH